MIGIEAVNYYICENHESNIGKVFDGEILDADFIKNRVGIEYVSRKSPEEQTSDLCIKALNNLAESYKSFDISEVDCICLCSRHGDMQIPHTSAILQNKLGLNEKCAAFDIHMGCSGYIYSLDIFKNFMQGNGFKKGLLFTCDPLSDYINRHEKSLDIILGDAATVTLLSDTPLLSIGQATYYTLGRFKDAAYLKWGGDEYLFMNGQMVFFQGMQYIPKIALENLQKNKLTCDDIDMFIFHQANTYMVEAIAKRMKLDLSKVPVDIRNYGNTSSSSIPIILSKNINSDKNIFHLSAIGDGFSINSVPLFRI